MQRPRVGKIAVVIDASCLIYLWYLDVLPRLVVRYYPIHIPRYVLEEVRRKGRSKRRLQELIRHNPFLKICDVNNEYDVQLLYDHSRNPLAAIDRGEAEVIIQARELNISEVLIDDRKGRTVARQHSLNPRGVLGILKEFKRIGYIAEIRPLIEMIRKKPLNYRISEKLLKQELKEIGET
jgi:hypothetical protein